MFRQPPVGAAGAAFSGTFACVFAPSVTGAKVAAGKAVSGAGASCFRPILDGLGGLGTASLGVNTRMSLSIVSTPEMVSPGCLGSLVAAWIFLGSLSKVA